MEKETTDNFELKKSGPNGRVVSTHKTEINRDSPWDRTAQYKNIESPASISYYDDIFAYQTPNTDGDRKTHYSFIHHFVDSDGKPGAASFRALSSAIAVLNGGRSGTILRGAAREGVYRHLAAHYADADIPAPELKSDEDVDALMLYKGLITEPINEVSMSHENSYFSRKSLIDIGVKVEWEDNGTSYKGLVVEANDDDALIELLDDEDNKLDELILLGYAEISATSDMGSDYSLTAQEEKADYNNGTQDEENLMDTISAELEAKISELVAKQISEALKQMSPSQEVAETEVVATEEVIDVKSTTDELAEDVKEIPAAEVVVEEVVVVEEQVVQAAVEAEVKAAEVAVAEAVEVADVVEEVAAPAAENFSISYSELKEFHQLLKEIAQ
jgi:hypothetical protein